MSFLDLKTYLNIFELCLIFHKKNQLSTFRNLEIHIRPRWSFGGCIYGAISSTKLNADKDSDMTLLFLQLQMMHWSYAWAAQLDQKKQNNRPPHHKKYWFCCFFLNTLD